MKRLTTALGAALLSAGLFAAPAVADSHGFCVVRVADGSVVDSGLSRGDAQSEVNQLNAGKTWGDPTLVFLRKC